MQISQEVYLLVAILQVIGTGVISALITGLWLNVRTEKLKAELQVKIEDYKKDLNKELENYKIEQEKKKLILSKLEQSHQLISQLFNPCTNLTSEVFLIISKENRYTNNSEAKSEEIRSYKELFKYLITPFEIIGTNLRIYAPELGDEITKLTDTINEIHQVSLGLLNGDLTNTDFLLSKQHKFFSLCVNLQTQIEEIVREHIEIKKITNND